MSKLSVNINKIATLRNARGGNLPDVLKAAQLIESFGAEGITVHPRPDQRHIRYSDVRDLRPLLKTEFNIEGNPEKPFMDLVLEVRPTQVTLVPDAHDAITSNAGWDTVRHRDFLTDICAALRENGIRSSIFIEADPRMAQSAAVCGADRVELYTEEYACEYARACGADYIRLREQAVAPYVAAAKAAREAGLGVNAGHDLNLDNLAYFVHAIPWTAEVSIGHALICDALYLGLDKTVREYLSLAHKYDY